MVMIRKGFIEHVTWVLAFGYEKKRIFEGLIGV
jgi:hypothetical protein